MSQIWDTILSNHYVIRMEYLQKPQITEAVKINPNPHFLIQKPTAQATVYCN